VWISRYYFLIVLGLGFEFFSQAAISARACEKATIIMDHPPDGPIPEYFSSFTRIAGADRSVGHHLTFKRNPELTRHLALPVADADLAVEVLPGEYFVIFFLKDESVANSPSDSDEVLRDQMFNRFDFTFPQSRKINVTFYEGTPIKPIVQYGIRFPYDEYEKVCEAFGAIYY
jgi:hypothetical protein